MADVPTLATAKTIDDEGPRRDDRSSSATGRCRGCSTSGWRRSTSAARCSAASPARGSTRSWSATRRSRSAVSAEPEPVPARRHVRRSAPYVKPGVDPALVVQAARRRSWPIIIAKGPTADEVQRAVMSEVSGRIRGLEQVGGFGGKAVDAGRRPDLCRRQRLLQKHARLLRGDHAGRGPRGDAAMAEAAGADDHPLAGRARGLRRDAKTCAAEARHRQDGRPTVKGDRPIPPIGQLAALDFPTIVHDRLSNGIPVEYVAAQRRAGHPGGAVVRRRRCRRRTGMRAGLRRMTMDLLDEGTTAMSSQAARRGAGAARRRHRQRQLGRPVVRDAVARCRRTSRRRST